MTNLHSGLTTDGRLVAHDLTKSYGQSPALRGISFEAAAGPDE